MPSIGRAALSVAVLVRTDRYLSRLRRGLVDPTGRVETERAWGLDLDGLFFSVIGC